MSRYDRCMLALLGLNLILGILVLPFYGRLDLFPFSSYALFDSVHKEALRPFVYFEAIDDRTIDPPQSAYQLVPLNQPGFLCFNDQLYDSWRNLSPLTSWDQASLAAAFKCLYPQARRIKYELRLTRLEQFEFLRSKKVIEEKSLGKFVYDF